MSATPRKRADARSLSDRSAFTLVEMLVSFAVLMLLMVVLITMVNLTTSSWSNTREKINQFQQAREAFDTIIRHLSDATLNPYYDYVNADGLPRTTANAQTFVPARYVRQSDLRFWSGPRPTGSATHPTHGVFFQAPMGASETGNALPNLLNTCGFYIEVGSDQSYLPTPLGSSFARERFRLMQLIEPSENLRVYGYTANSSYNERTWFTHSIGKGVGVSIAAENIIALIILPKLTVQDQQAGGFTDDSLSPDYTYDSTSSNSNAALNPKNQLPPIVQVTLIAIDENSANRMTTADNAALRSFLDARFQDAGNTTDPEQPGYSQDLKSTEQYLIDQKIGYQVFTSNVSLKAAKWSRQQKN